MGSNNKNRNIVVDSVLCYISNTREKISGDKLKQLVQCNFTTSEIQRALRLVRRLTDIPSHAKCSHNGVVASDPVGVILRTLDAARKNGWPLPEFAAVDISHFPNFDHAHPSAQDRPGPSSKTLATNATDSHLLLCILQELGAVKRMVEQVTSSTSAYGRKTNLDSSDAPLRSSIESVEDEAPLLTESSGDETPLDVDEQASPASAMEPLETDQNDSPTLDDDETTAGGPSTTTIVVGPSSKKLTLCSGRSIEKAVAKLKAIRSTTPDQLSVRIESGGNEKSPISRHSPAAAAVAAFDAADASFRHYRQLSAVATTLAQQQQQQQRCGAFFNQYNCQIFSANAHHSLPSSGIHSAFHQLLPGSYSDLVNAVLHPTQPPKFSLASTSDLLTSNAGVKTPTIDRKSLGSPKNGSAIGSQSTDSIALTDSCAKYAMEAMSLVPTKYKANAAPSIFDLGVAESNQMSGARPSTTFKCYNDCDGDGKPYICQHDNCNKRFANKFLLKKHEFIHTGERPHQCTYCSKRFNRKDNLLRHKKTHKASSADSYETEERQIQNLVVPSMKQRKRRPTSFSGFHKIASLASPPIRAETGGRLSALLSMKHECRIGNHATCKNEVAP